MAIVTGAGVLVLLLGGLASGVGVGTATLPMDIVVAALVVGDEVRKGAGGRGHILTNRPTAKVRRARPRRIDRCLRILRGRIVAPPRRARRAREAPASREPARVGPEAQAGGVRRAADPEAGRGDPRPDRGAEQTGDARGPGVRAREARRRAPADRAAGE